LTTKAANDLQTQTKEEEESTLLLHWSAICCTSLTMKAANDLQTQNKRGGRRNHSSALPGCIFCTSLTGETCL
jgi:hypothetical protein